MISYDLSEQSWNDCWEIKISHGDNAVYLISQQSRNEFWELEPTEILLPILKENIEGSVKHFWYSDYRAMGTNEKFVPEERPDIDMYTFERFNKYTNNEYELVSNERGAEVGASGLFETVGIFLAKSIPEALVIVILNTIKDRLTDRIKKIEERNSLQNDNLNIKQIDEKWLLVNMRAGIEYHFKCSVTELTEPHMVGDRYMARAIDSNNNTYEVFYTVDNEYVSHIKIVRK